MKKIAIIGATGFIGRELIDHFLKYTKHELVAVSRSEYKSTSSRVSWKKCDLFSVLDIEKALSGADTIIYLVHSMQPSARLDQANFADYDLILADNLGRAAKKLNINRVIYLGGLLPEKEKMSPHLQSRFEVEQVLSEYIPNYTIFRAGLILGAHGSSFHILLNLVKRLRVMICPLWTQNLTSPTLVDDVKVRFKEALEDKQTYKKVYDLGAYDRVSYIKLMQLVAKYLKTPRGFIKVPVSFLLLSRLWVSLITGASRKLVYPLVESLNYSLVPRDEYRYKKGELLTYSSEKAISTAIVESKTVEYSFSKRQVERSTVRSVQRAILPDGFKALNVAQEYMSWLPKFLYPIIRVDVEDEYVFFKFITKSFNLLILKYSPERSTSDRQIFYIRGGLLAKKGDRGRLEFREALNSKYTLSAIHDFHPALPWYIYRYTQALVHLIVMHAFGKHLKNIHEGKSQCLQKL